MRKIDSDITTVFSSHGPQMKLAAGRLYFFHLSLQIAVHVTQKLEIEHHFVGLDQRK